MKRKYEVGDKVVLLNTLIVKHYCNKRDYKLYGVYHITDVHNDGISSVNIPSSKTDGKDIVLNNSAIMPLSEFVLYFNAVINNLEWDKEHIPLKTQLTTNVKIEPAPF